MSYYDSEYHITCTDCDRTGLEDELGGDFVRVGIGKHKEIVCVDCAAKREEMESEAA